MKRRIPLLIVLVLGIAMMVIYFIPHIVSKNIFMNFLDWQLAIGVFALVLGLGSIILHHVEKIRRRQLHWPYSWVTLISLVVVAFIGLFGGMEGKGPISMEPFVRLFGKTIQLKFSIQTFYNHMIIPLGSTMFALLAFFMASAAYRSFRARSVEATILLVSAFVVMIGIIPLGHLISPKIPYLAQWILDVPNTATQRGILFGVALGGAATSLKILLGIERGWLGGGS